jgi:hypothetical protein
VVSKWKKFHFQFYNVFNKAAALLRISGGPVRRKKSRAVQMVLIHYRCRELFTSSSLETKVGILSRVEKGGSGDNSAEIVWPKCDFSRGLCCRRLAVIIVPPVPEQVRNYYGACSRITRSGSFGEGDFRSVIITIIAKGWLYCHVPFTHEYASRF